MNREEAYRIVRRAAGDALPNQGDSLILGRKGGFEFLPFGLLPIKTKTVDYDVEGKDVGILVDAIGGERDVNLPPAAYTEYRVLFIKKIDVSGNAVLVKADGSEKIDGGSLVTLSSQWDSALIVSDGSAWYKIG